MSEVAIPKEYSTAEGLRTLANFLRSQNGIKVRSAIEHEKRVEYFKGKRLVECILDAKKWPKTLPRLTDRSMIHIVANSLIQSAFFHRSEKLVEKKGYFRVSQKNVFEEGGYYTWMYAGNQVWSNIATGAVIAVVVGFTLLPIWPDVAKKILWYLSVTFLIGTLSFCLVRFVLFLVLWMFGYEFWIFPRLFDESLSFQDSFKPIYSFDKGTPGQGYYRIGVLLMLCGFVYWACTQPTEFDQFLKANRDLIDDIYSGNLLADVAANPKDTLDRQRRHDRVPNIDDLLRTIAEEERLDSAPHNDEAKGEGSDAVEDFLSDNKSGRGSEEENRGEYSNDWTEDVHSNKNSNNNNNDNDRHSNDGDAKDQQKTKKRQPDRVEEEEDAGLELEDSVLDDLLHSHDEERVEEDEL